MATSKQVTVQRLKKILEDHFEDDKKNFEAIHRKLDALATKKDTKQIMQAIGVVKSGSVVFKLGWKTILVGGSIATAIIAITGAWKAILAIFIVGK